MIAMEELNEKLREKIITIQALNQKLEVLQLQLSGSQKRANQQAAEISNLQSTIAEKDLEIQTLTAEVRKYKGALDAMGKQVQDLRSESVEATPKVSPDPQVSADSEELLLARRQYDAVSQSLQTLTRAATAILLEEPEAIQHLRTAVMEVGDPKYRVLNFVLKSRRVSLDEIASFLVADVSEAHEIVDLLQTEGEVQLKDAGVVTPGEKYLVVKIPAEEWKSMNPPEIFDSLEETILKIEGREGIVQAIESAVDILELKLSRGGALIYEMRKTASSWKGREGNIQELQYKIKDWKARAV
jgi:hypothetical protein